MRILHFGPSGFEQTDFSLLGGLTNLGHQVQTCDVIAAKEDIGSTAEKAIEEFQPAMVVTIGGWYLHFDCQSLWQVLKRHGLPHIYWAIEDPVFFDWTSTVHLREYDFVFTIGEKCVDEYIKLGTPAAYLPHACSPHFHKPAAPHVKFQNDIIVISNKYTVAKGTERFLFRGKCFEDLVEPVLQKDYDIKIYGAGWDDGEYHIPQNKLGGIVSRELVPTIYSSSKMVLIIQWDYDGHVCHKTFEALGCKCLQIAPYTPVQEKYFKHGEHIVYSRSPEETLYYVDYYLENQDEREQIAARGQEEAYKNHNLTLRAGNALSVLKRHGFNIN